MELIGALILGTLGAFLGTIWEVWVRNPKPVVYQWPKGHPREHENKRK